MFTSSYDDATQTWTFRTETKSLKFVGDFETISTLLEMVLEFMHERDGEMAARQEAA